MPHKTASNSPVAQWHEQTTGRGQPVMGMLHDQIIGKNQLALCSHTTMQQVDALPT